MQSDDSGDSEITDVMFRVGSNRNGRDVFALFPGHAGTNAWWTCSCYQHIGQHSSADLSGCIADSTPATPTEYRDLKRELEGCGYRLNIVTRGTPRHEQARRDQIARVRA